MSLNPITALFGMAGKAWGEYQGRKAAAEAGAARIEEKKIELRAAKIEAQTTLTLSRAQAESARYSQRLAADADHDARVQANRQHTKMDEFLILTFSAIFILPFAAPVLDLLVRTTACAVGDCMPFGFSLGLQKTVAEGWAAHGYDKAPLWFEFAMIGILVSTLGLMRLFQSFFSAFKMKFFGGSGHAK